MSWGDLTPAADLLARMPRCRDCRWWEPIPGAMSGLCHSASWGTVGPKDSLAKAVGANGVEPASLMTKPDFGCIQNEAKP